MTDRFNQLIAFLLFASVAVNLHSLIGWNNTLIGNDGIQYLTTAKNWLAGLGFSTDALMYAPHFQGSIPAPQTVWPPGYPAAIGLLSLTGLELKTTALALNFVCHALAGVLVGLILLRAGFTRRSALFCALMFYLMAKPWLYAVSLATEPVFITFILAATLALPSIRSSGVSRWVFCGVLICACIFIRYSGVFFAFGAGTGIFAYLVLYERNANFFSSFIKLTLLTLISVVGFAYLMIRTQLLIGTLERYSGTKQPETLVSTIKLWSAQTSELMGFNAGGVFKYGGSLSLFVIYIVLILALTSLFFYRKLHSKNHTMPSQSMEFFRLSTLVMAAHSITMIAYLTYSSMDETPLEIINRYIYQIYPCIYIAFCIMANALLQNSTLKNSNKPSQKLAIPIFVVAFMYMLTQANELLSERKPYFADSIIINNLFDLPVTKNIDVSTYMVNCVESVQPTAAAWSTHGQYLHLKNDLPTITQDKIYTNQPFDAAFFEQSINDYNIKLFVFMEFQGRFSEQYNEHMAATKKWLISNQYSIVPLLESRVDASHSIEMYTKNPECGL